MDEADHIFTLPNDSAPKNFENAKDAVAHLIGLYQTAADFLCEKFVSVLESALSGCIALSPVPGSLNGLSCWCWCHSTHKCLPELQL